MNTSASQGGRIRALALDIDGTLLDPSHRIRPAVRDAVRRVDDAGVAVILASARSVSAIRPLQAELGIGCRLMVACQGGISVRILPPDASRPGVVAFSVVDSHPLATADALAVLDVAAKRNLPVSWFGWPRWIVERGDVMAWREARIVGDWPSVVPDLREIAQAEPAYKLTVMAPAGREAELAAVAAELPAGLRGAISRADYLEITDRSVSKASALAAVLRHLGLEPSQLAAAGDGANDEEMLRLAGHSMAMGHAPAALRALATWTLPSNAEDGLAAGLDRLFAEGLIDG